MIFDARTGFLFLGILSLIVALALWTVLFRQRTLALHLWCSGSLAGAAAVLVLALHPILPEGWGLRLANLLAMLMLGLKLQAIRVELGEPESVSRLAALMLIYLVVCEFLQIGVSDAWPSFMVILLAFGIMNARIASWAWRLGRQPGHRSADWIAGAYALMAALYAFRLIRTGLGDLEARLLTQGYDALLFAIISAVGIIVSNIAWLGLALDRLLQAQIETAAAQARNEENQRLSQQIAQLDRQRSLGLLSASLGHELKQPLTAILTNAQVVRRGLCTDRLNAAQSVELLDRIVHNTRRASQIIEHIRGFIRPAATRREPVNLGQVIQEVAELVAAEARTRQVYFAFSLSERPLSVRGDSIQLSQIVLNVFRNAIEAVADGERREVQVRLREQAGRALLEVQDSGPGLTPEALLQASQPFFTTKVEGLGLGLSIARAIAEQHGGALVLTNAAEGGALAELILPLTPKHDWSIDR
jgi:signal transduction histidine kinase